MNDETELGTKAGAPALQADRRPESHLVPGTRHPVIVPIRSLGENHRDRIRKHLIALDAHDRYLRFGYSAGDEQIGRYVDSLDFQRDEIFGIYNRKLALIAMAHLAYPSDKVHGCGAEFGVSVSKTARGRGYGARLFDRAAMHARNDGINQMFIHALTENSAMLKIARRAGAIVQQDGSESEAHLLLPAATLDTRMSEIVLEQVAQADYRLKSHAKNLRAILDGFHACGPGLGNGSKK